MQAKLRDTAISPVWNGSYFDGKTAAKTAVGVQLLDEGLRLTLPSSEVLFWPYAEIRQTQGFYAGEPVRLERGAPIPAALVVEGNGFLSSLHAFAPRRAGRFHNPARRGLRLRLTLYAAAAAIACCVFLYGWGIPLAARAVTPYVPLDWERGAGASALPLIVPEQSRCKDPELQRVVDGVVARLAAADPGPYSFRVHLSTLPVINAVALPGGDIVVFSGLLRRLDSPELLAAVLAHEMQHVTRRHATRRVIEESSAGLLLTVVTGDLTGAALYGASAANNLAMLGYSRRDEEEADAGGFRMLVRAGIDPQNMVRFFEALKKTEGQVNVPKYLSTHPDLNDRIAKLKAMNVPPFVPRVAGERGLPAVPGWKALTKRCASPVASGNGVQGLPRGN